MTENEPEGNEDGFIEDEEGEDFQKDERSARSFLILLGLLTAVIFLSILLALPLSDFHKLLILIFVFCCGVVGTLLLQWRKGRSLNDLAGDNEETKAVPAFIESMADAANEQEEEREEVSFEQLVQQALATIPEEFHGQMDNLVVVVEDEPDPEALQLAGTREGQTLLGLYHGVPLTTWGHHQALLPEKITIYQRTIELYCGGDPVRIREQVRATVLHEVAHHFGLGHEEMPIWIK